MQLPRINGSYILQCPSGGFTCTMGSCGCVRGGKVSIDSQDRLWSFAITIDGNVYIKGSTGDQSIGGTTSVPKRMQLSGPALRFWWPRATLKIEAPYNICTSVIACISLDVKLRIVT